jgi:uncharacterized surface protein with fasciclin (FAS1) repeats
MRTSRKTLNAAISAAYARADHRTKRTARARPHPLPDGGPSPRARARLVSDILAAVLQNGEAAGVFATFARAVRAAGLTSLPPGLGPFTLFAPTNRAFARLPAGERDALFSDPVRLAQLVTHHLVAREVGAPHADIPTVAMAADGRALQVTADGPTYRVNGARLVKPHIHTSNGTVRGIDTVLLPR